MSEMRHRVVNFGCRLNSFESGQIDHFLAESGRDDLIVVNSCAVTNETERQVRQKVRQLVLRILAGRWRWLAARRS